MLFASSIQIFADLAPPPTPVKQGKIFRTNLSVVPDGNASEARLQITKESLRQLRAALDDPGARDGSITQRIAGSSSRTIVAGMFLFMSLSFGGVWLARAGAGRGQKLAAAVMLGAAIMGAAAIMVRANAGPPPGWSWRNLPKNLGTGVATRGSVEIEIVPEGNGVKLVVPLFKENTSAEQKPGQE